MPLGFEIGYVISNDSYNMITYSFHSCDYTSKSMIYRDYQFCRLFNIDSKKGTRFHFKQVEFKDY
jgi:hypothetical protein